MFDTEVKFCIKLFFDIDDFTKVRFDFYNVTTEMFREAFTHQYFDWCNKNNLIAKRMYESKGFSATGVEDEDEVEEIDFSPEELTPRPQHSNSEKPEPYRNEGPKIGRNDPCPCGSGKKYKNCCGKNA